MYDRTTIKLTEFQRQTLAYLLFCCAYDSATGEVEIHNTTIDGIDTAFSSAELLALKQVSLKVERKAKLPRSR